MTRKIGAHVSASGGLDKAIERASLIGANCAQIFSGSPRVWKRKNLSEFNTKKMFSKMKELNVNPIFTHSLYLVNLATDKPDLLRKSFDVLKYDLEFDSLIKGSGIVVHLGSHTGRGWESVKEQVADQIVALLRVTPENSTFLIENSAGQSGKLCSNLEDIRWLLDRIAEKMGNTALGLRGDGSGNGIDAEKTPAYGNRIGWCMDTCHAFAAGYSLGESQESLMSKNILQEISGLKLWNTLKCIHVNDSKDDFDSGRDRHENLGKGKISQKDIEFFINDERVKKIPLIIEVPGYDGTGPDAQNVTFLRSLCK